MKVNAGKGAIMALRSQWVPLKGRRRLSTKLLHQFKVYNTTVRRLLMKAENLKKLYPYNAPRRGYNKLKYILGPQTICERWYILSGEFHIKNLTQTFFLRTLKRRRTLKGVVPKVNCQANIIQKWEVFVIMGMTKYQIKNLDIWIGCCSSPSNRNFNFVNKIFR